MAMTLNRGSLSKYFFPDLECIANGAIIYNSPRKYSTSQIQMIFKANVFKI